MAAMQWNSTINKTGKKIQVDETNVVQVAGVVFNTMQKIFGQDPLQWDDDVWLRWIEPWQEQFIHNLYTFDGLVKVQDLEDEIEALLQEAHNG